MRYLALLAIVVACGGRSADAPIVIPAQPDGGSADASARAVDARPTVKKDKTKGPGADGPRDAEGMLGEIGRVVREADTLLLVNSAEIRVHPAHDAISRAITAVLVGWKYFMPHDLVDPIKDVDWALMAGSLILGSTQQNVFLARYNLSEDRADAVMAQLVARLPVGKKEPSPVGKIPALSAYLDGAQRFYMRPKPGLLAIVPPSEAKADAEMLAKTEVPVHVRPKELLRLSASGRRRGLRTLLPASVTAVRIWIYATADDKLHLEGEGDCASEDVAIDAASQIRLTFEDMSRSMMARIAAGKLIDGDAVWVDKKTVRYQADVDAQVFDLIATAMEARNPY